MIFIARLMIVLGGVLFGLLHAPRIIVPFIFHALIDRERGNPDARQAEVIGAIIVSGLGMGIRTNGQPKFLRHGLHHGIKRSPLRSGNFHFLRRAERRHVVIVEVEADLAGRNRRMLAQIFRSQQTLLFRRNRSKQNRPPRFLRGL